MRYRLVLLTIFALLLAGCGGGGNSSPSSTEPPLFSGSTASASTAATMTVTGAARALVGTWKELSDTAGSPLETCQFDEDGSLACTAGNGQDQVGAWSQVDDDHISLSYSGASTTVEYHIDGKKLTVIFNNADPVYTQVYEKE